MSNSLGVDGWESFVFECDYVPDILLGPLCDTTMCGVMTVSEKAEWLRLSLAEEMLEKAERLRVSLAEEAIEKAERLRTALAEEAVAKAARKASRSKIRKIREKREKQDECA